MRKVIAYIDALNLQHAISDLGEPKLKWFNPIPLVERLLGGDQRLDKVKYFAAIPPWSTGRREQKAHCAAIRHHGGQVTLGIFKTKIVRCRGTCGERFNTFEEKETDVNIAGALIGDAIGKRFDRAMVISADTDLRAAIRIALEEAPASVINVIAPPGRFGFARDLRPIMELSKGRIRKAALADRITDANGNTIAERPARWS